MRTSAEGIELIKRHEGLRLKAYDDFQPNLDITDASQVKGTLTIGYGHTEDVEVGQVITEEQAEALLVYDLGTAEAAVRDLFRYCEWPDNQQRFDALVSWAFNTGTRGLKGRNLSVAIEALHQAERQVFEVWTRHYVTSKGVKLPGLVKRREEEANLFLNKQ